MYACHNLLRQFMPKYLNLGLRKQQDIVSMGHIQNIENGGILQSAHFKTN